jgi:hypothetical protein
MFASGRLAALIVVLFAVSVLCTACGPAVDLKKGLQVQLVSTGWADAGLVDGKNKLVPAVTFTLKNLSDQKLVVLQINAIFRRVNEKEEMGSGLLPVIGSDGLAPGASTKALTIKSQLGYTSGEETRFEMLKNSHFVDASVQLFAKYGSTQWTLVGEYPIVRQLLNQ